MQLIDKTQVLTVLKNCTKAVEMIIADETIDTEETYMAHGAIATLSLATGEIAKLKPYDKGEEPAMRMINADELLNFIATTTIATVISRLTDPNCNQDKAEGAKYALDAVMKEVMYLLNGEEVKNE